MIPLTAIILTKDEAINIERCLNGLREVEDVVIVDSGSSDGTLEIAQRVRPDVRIFHHPFQDFGDQRNWALDRTEPRHEWILFVDADEFCTEPFVQELRKFVSDPGDLVGAYIAGKYYFLGKWIRRSSLYPSYQLRLLRKGFVRYRKAGHGQVEELNGSAGYLVEGWIHEGMSKGIFQWMERHNHYAREEAQRLCELREEKVQVPAIFGRDPRSRRREMKKLSARLPFRPLVAQIYTLFLCGAILDGPSGWLFVRLQTSYRILIDANRKELEFLDRRAMRRH